MLRTAGSGAARAATAAVVLIAGGCAHLHWPWQHAPAPPPQPVHELDIAGAAGTFGQYWKRNTLLVDLTSARGSGTIVLRPAADTTWPVRLAFRVMPGSFGELEVRAAERVILPIAAGGSSAIDLELAPGVYTASSSEMTVSWGPAGAAAP
jgi:hypothetical protein